MFFIFCLYDYRSRFRRNHRRTPLSGHRSGNTIAVDTLKLLARERHKLILWTVREGDLLNEAVEFCRSRGLEFYAVNSNYPEEKPSHSGYSRKLKADLFIDDRNLGGLPDWGLIYRMIQEGLSFEDIYSHHLSQPPMPAKQLGFWERLRKIKS